MDEYEKMIGNWTTIIMIMFSTCGGGAIIDVLGGSSQAAIFIGAVLGLIFSIVNAYFPDKLKILNNHNNSTCTCKPSTEDVEVEDDSVESSDDEMEDETIVDENEENIADNSA